MSKSTSSNNSVLYLFLLSLVVSFFVILLFSQSSNKSLSASDVSENDFLASVYIPINFEEELKDETVAVVNTPKIEVKTKQLPIKLASKSIETKKHVEEIVKVTPKYIPSVISTPKPVRKKSAVMSYAITSAPIVAPREIQRTKPQIVREKPRVFYEAPRKQSKPDTSSLEREIQALAMKKLEKEISGK